MCGVSGFFSYQNTVDPKRFYQAHLKLKHRGPDDEGFVYQNYDKTIEALRGDDTVKELAGYEHIVNKDKSGLIMGHRRLSIIDLTPLGHQPYRYEGLCLVYNGEIYNYIEIREVLKSQGYCFTTSADSEVFLKAFHCWGTEAFCRFNGMWAAAIYDSQKDQLTLTRDRFGIKPLYYSFVDDNLIFGSEIKFISSFFDKLYVNREMVCQYLRYSYSDHTQQTMFRDVLQIEPGTYCEFSRAGLTTYSYWKMHDHPQATQLEIENILKDSIRLRLRSDVEVGSLLSGGIDSSTILGLIDAEQYVGAFKTFSVVFDDEAFSEKKYIDEFQTRNIKLEKHFVYPQTEGLIEKLNELVYVHEEPWRGLAVYSQYLIYEYIKKNSHVKVLLNGQGADEIFTGYTEYHYTYLSDLLLRLKFGSFVRELRAYCTTRNLSCLRTCANVFTKILSDIYRPKNKHDIFVTNYESVKTQKKYTSRLKNQQWNNLVVSALREYLRYEDRNSMRFSLESRLPFLDYRLVEKAFSLGDDKKIHEGVSKKILRTIAQGKVPESILNRSDKTGFELPEILWQKTGLKENFDSVFNDIHLNGLFSFLNHKKIYAYYQKYTQNKIKDWSLVSRLYSLYLWKKVWSVSE